VNEIISIILLGIVEGVTEFLPVSSTGHLILATKLLGYDAARWGAFNVIIQLVAFIPAAVIGLAIHKQIEALLGNAEVVAVALIVGGLAIIAVERLAPKSDIVGVADIPLPKVIGIGFLQCLAMVPGVSRSGATILGALALGVERRTAAEFSFFLAIPTMLGATALELVKNRHEMMSGEGVGLGAIALGFAVSFVVALLVVKWFIGVVTRYGFVPFAVYRIIAGAIALAWLSTL
jgi:undecaprenyl-diphosphatase